MQLAQSVESILHFDEIKAIYQKRCSKKEFPTSSYIAYLQFGVVNNEHGLVSELLEYAFSDLYPKLPWLERIHSLDIACKMRHKNFEQYMEMFTITFMRVDFNQFMTPSIQTQGRINQVSTHNLLQMMALFQLNQIKNLEAWKKAIFLLSDVYYQTLEEHKKINKRSLLGK